MTFAQIQHCYDVLNVFVTTFGAVAFVSRVSIKLLPAPKRAGAYRTFLNGLAHCGLFFGTLYSDF
jgi:FAD/FMN-containing dehydrogenase